MCEQTQARESKREGENCKVTKKPTLKCRMQIGFATQDDFLRVRKSKKESSERFFPPKMKISWKQIVTTWMMLEDVDRFDWEITKVKTIRTYSEDCYNQAL